ncbi:WD40 repeat protein [Kibdelosporangium banguiense]|uniref:WD40 repeat protein n=1 Tax=Kibdelosporangium banguiense TaxID=1365924 RepID=A0ABS4TJX3_9PSEU|nr:hypothetical protein [Kibdelosporangium banguiense]MBP2324715.1 WD40 repeat protein [Kibdelosporangium banguiense]
MGRRERFLDPDTGLVQRFAFELRQLRDSAGRPSYRELAQRAHYSVTALSEAAGGRTFPSLAVTLAYVQACAGDRDMWLSRWQAVSDELAPDSDDDDVAAAPYLGLATFRQEDANRFHGRGRLIEELCSRIERDPFLAVFGASGIGKSSLLRAGLLPAIGRGDVAGGEHWPVILCTPGRRPIEQLAIQLANLNGISAVPVATQLAAEPGSVGVLVKQMLATRPEQARLVIVVDQFEEIFTLCPDEQERTRFIDCLLAVAEGCDGQARIVLGARADFYARCARYPGLVAALRDRQVLVGPMEADDLRCVIREPAVSAGLTVEKALVETIVADARGEPGALPLISHALLETWKRRSGDMVTLAGYQRTGGVHGAIAQTADRVYDEFDSERQRIVRNIVLRLTALGEGTEDTRRRVTRTELLSGSDSPAVATVLARLTAARLVTVGKDTVEVAHEALIRSWPRLQAWLVEDRESLAAHRRLTETVIEWERHGRDEGLLYRGAQLAAWQIRPQDSLNDAERTFLADSHRAKIREHRTRRRRVRLTIGGLASATAAVTVLAVLAWLSADRAENESRLAFSRQLVATARAQLQLDPELGLLLAKEAFRTNPNADSEAMLSQAAVASHVRASIPAHQGKVTGVAFSPDGKHLATSGADGMVRVWACDHGRVSTASPVELAGHHGEVWNPVFSPDGNRIAAAGIDGTATIWDWTSGAPPLLLQGHQDKVWSVAFSPDGQQVASASQDGTLRIWTINGSELTVLRGHNERVLGVAFSPDGRRLASSGGDNTVRIWTLDDTRAPIVLRGHENSVESVAFSPDGQHLATASTDGTVRVWDTDGSPGSVVLGTHDGTAESATYSRDGRWIASTGNDGTVRVWNATSHARPLVLRGHHGTVWAAAFDPDGWQLASASDDGTARVWDIDEVGDATVLRGHDGPARGAVFSPDGRTLASASDDGTVRIWDTTGKTEPRVLHGQDGLLLQVTFSSDGQRVASVADNGTVRIHMVTGKSTPVVLHDPGPVWQVAFSPDGQRLAAANRSGSIRIWNTTTGADEPTQLQGDQGALCYVAWSPDGRHIASAGPSGTVLVWDLTRTGAPAVFRGHQGLVWTVAFSPDGKRLASGGNDGTVRIWSISGETDPLVLHGHQGVVWSVAFSADGHTLATSGNDATVRLWQFTSTRDPLQLQGFRASVETVTFSTDGRLATAHDDGTVRIWRCEVCRPINDVLAFADQHLTRQLTAEERKTYLNEPSA